jgi:hypothetical protein
MVEKRCFLLLFLACCTLTEERSHAQVLGISISSGWLFNAPQFQPFFLRGGLQAILQIKMPAYTMHDRSTDSTNLGE